MEVKFLSFEPIEARLMGSACSWIYHRKDVNLDSFACVKDRKLRRGSVEHKTKPPPSLSLPLSLTKCVWSRVAGVHLWETHRVGRFLQPDRSILIWRPKPPPPPTQKKKPTKTDRNSREYAPATIKHRRGSFLYQAWVGFLEDRKRAARGGRRDERLQ